MPLLPPGGNATQEDWNAFFEGHGEAKIRHMLHTGGWPQQLHLPAVEWLARRESASASVLAVENSRLADAASRSADAAERQAAAAESANKRSTIALWVSGAAILIALAGLLSPIWMH